MKRHFSILVCALVAVAMMLTFASCDLIAPKHEHTYSGTWSSDATNHWHAATCNEEGCAAAKASVTAHSDADENKICDVCAYDMGHEHTYSESWATDAENHWHAASCGHNAVADKAAHDLDDNGLCSVCGYIDGALDVAKAVQLGVSFKDLVNKVVANYTYAAYAGGNFSSYSVEYELGNGVAHITDNGAECDYWYSLKNDELFAVQEYDGEASLVYDPDVNSMKGYNFSNVFSYYGDEEFYGVDELVSGLYDLAAQNFGGATQEYIVVVDGVTYYVFSFATIESEMQYDEELEDDVEVIKSLFETQVMFTLTDNYSFGNVTVDTTKYAVLDYNDDYELVESGIVEFEYDEIDDTKIVGYEIVMFTADGSFVYDIAQTEGERDLEAKYDADKSLVSSFELSLEDGTPITETINLVAGTTGYVYLADVAPATYNIGLNEIEVSEPNWGVNGNWNSYFEAITLTSYKAGEYTVTISINNVEKQYKVVVTAPATTEISATINSDKVENYNCYSDSTGGATVVFGATANNYADSGFTAMLPPTAMNATLTNNEDGTYSFVSTTTGTWQILITSTANSEVTSVLTINVQTPPAVSDILNGEYKADMSDFWTTNTVTAVFTPSTEGATEGTVVVEYYFSGFDYSVYQNVEISVTEKMTYAYADGVITVTSVSVEGAEESLGLTFAINDMYKITVTGKQFYNMAMTAVVDNGLEGSGTENDPYILTAIGDYNCAFPGGYIPVLYSFTATATGTATLSSTCGSAFLMIGPSLYDVSANEGNGASLTLAVTEGTTYYIGVADWNEQAMDVPFSITIA